MGISLIRFLRNLSGLLCFQVNIRQDEDSIVGDAPKKGIDYTAKLPVNILALLFVDCVASSVHSSSPFTSIHPSAAPLVLGQVNKRWRWTALNTPELWSSIYVRNNTRQEILQLWLARSGTTSSLNLRIEAVHMVTDLMDVDVSARMHPLTRNPRLRTSTDVGRAWLFLTSQIHRWRRIDLNLDVQTVHDFLELPLMNATRLQDLSITVVVPDEPAFPMRVLDYLQASIQSPNFNLQKLSWECIPIEKMTTHKTWGSLREIELNMGVTMDQSVEFLKACARAEEVTLACITDDCMLKKEHELQLEAAHQELMTMGFNQLPLPARHILPNLQRLSIGMGGVIGDCLPIMAFFVCPALINLQMQSFDTSARSCALLGRFFERSAGVDGQWKFRELSIIDHNMPEGIVIQLLSARELAETRVPDLNCYTRRSLRVSHILDEVERLGGKKPEFFPDALRGTWIGRH